MQRFPFSKELLSDFDKELLSSNLVGAKTLDELFELEQNITADRILEIKLSPIAGSFDYIHFKSLHKELFQDIYKWAGEDRNTLGYYGVFRKGSTEFTSGDKLPIVAKGLFDALEAENHFENLDKDVFIKSAASFLNGLNILHPFREGNGRAQRLFMELLAGNAGYNLDLSTISKNINIQASILGAKGQLTGFEKIIQYGMSQVLVLK